MKDFENESVDRRVVKTKAKLVSVFKELISEKSFEDITVNEICEKADIRRATFYKHYNDKYAFLAYFVESMRYEFDRRYNISENADNTVEYYTNYAAAAISFFERHENLVNNTLNSEVLHIIANIVMERNFEITLSRLEECDCKNLPASPRIVASMMTGAVSGAILNWLKSGKKIPRDIFIDEISSVIMAMLIRK